MASKKYFVFSGGGISGLAHIGAIKALSELELFDPQECVGTSVGAIIAMLICVGYSSTELIEIGKTLHFGQYRLIEPLKLFSHFGFDSGKILVDKLKQLIKDKLGDSEITFEELYNRTDKCLTVTGSCINTGQPIYFNRIDTPQAMLYDAVRVSIGIPVYYTTVSYKDNLCVDGGIFDNYPIHRMIDKDTAHVLGIRIISNSHIEDDGKPIKGIGNYFQRLLCCLLCEIEKLRNKDCLLMDTCTINIDTRAYNALNFDILLEEKVKLIELGYQKTKEYFQIAINDSDELK